MARVNRKFKDSLFRMVFHGKEELLSLYNAVNGSAYTNADDLEINTLEDAVYMGMKNDISFLFASYLNLYEAQSTSNPNMPLRGTIYFADLLKGWIESNQLDVYSEKQIMIPRPKYIIFYNGLKEEPERRILRLSDSFEGERDEEAALECTAVMLNINYGYNRELMEKCQTLHDYSWFVEVVRQGVRTGKTLENAVDEAIDKSLKEGVLKDLLRKNRAEVKNVVLTEYNEELHLKNVRECGYEDGLDTGHFHPQRISGMKSYYYLDYLHREIFLEEEDIQTVPESGRADDACSAIAEKPYVVEQFMADSFRTLKDVASRLCDSPDIKSRHDALMYIVWRVALDIKEWRTLSHSEAAVKVTREDGFVWLLVSAENARKLWEADVFSLYRLYADDSESLIESEAELESTIKGGYQIGIEVGFASVMDHAARMKQQ